MKAHIIVTLKNGILDPQGKAIEGALGAMDIEGISSVRQGKIFEIELDNTTPEKAQESLQQASKRLLANPVMENYSIEILS